MPVGDAPELRNTQIRIQKNGSPDVFQYQCAEAAINREVLTAQAPRDPYGGVIRHNQSTWAWRFLTVHEMSQNDLKLLGLRGLGNPLSPDTLPISYDIEATTEDGINRRLLDCALVSLTIAAEKRKLVSIESMYHCRVQREASNPLVVTEEEQPHHPISGGDVSVEIDDVPTDCYAVQLVIDRNEYIPTNYDTNGEPRNFNGAGQWNAVVQLALPEDQLPVYKPEARYKIKVQFGTIGSITLPTVFTMKPTQSLVADDWDQRMLMGRAEAAPEKNFAEIVF